MKTTNTIIACILTLGTVLAVSPAAYAEELPPQTEEVAAVTTEEVVEEQAVVEPEPTTAFTETDQPAEVPAIAEQPAVETPHPTADEEVATQTEPFVQAFSMDEPVVTGVTQMQFSDSPENAFYQVTWNPPKDANDDFYMTDVTYDYVFTTANGGVVLSGSTSTPSTNLPYSVAPSFSQVFLTVTPHVLIEGTQYSGTPVTRSHTITKGVPSITVGGLYAMVDAATGYMNVYFNISGSTGGDPATLYYDVSVNGNVVDTVRMGDFTSGSSNSSSYNLLNQPFGEVTITVYTSNNFGKSNTYETSFTYEGTVPEALTNTTTEVTPTGLTFRGTAEKATQVNYVLIGDDGSIIEGFEYTVNSQYTIPVTLSGGVTYDISLTPQSVHRITGPTATSSYYMPQATLPAPPIAEIQKVDPLTGEFIIVWDTDRGNITEADSVLVSIEGDAYVVPLEEGSSSFTVTPDENNEVNFTVQYNIAEGNDLTAAEQENVTVDFRTVTQTEDMLADIIEGSETLDVTVEDGAATVSPLNGWFSAALYNQTTGLLVADNGWVQFDGTHSFNVALLSEADYVAVYRNLNGAYSTGEFTLAADPEDNGNTGGGDNGGVTTPPVNKPEETAKPDSNVPNITTDDTANQATVQKASLHELERTGADNNNAGILYGFLTVLAGMVALTASYIRRKKA